MAAEDDAPASALDLAQSDLDLSPEVPSPNSLDLDLAPEPAENVTKNKALKAEVGNQVFSYVARLHKNLGHPSPEVLQRMLTEVQATADVLKAAKEYIFPSVMSANLLPVFLLPLDLRQEHLATDSWLTPLGSTLMMVESVSWS